MIDKIKELTTNYFEEVVQIRRHLHQYPELSFHEHKTSAYIKSILDRWGIPFKEDIAETGILVVLQGRNPGKKTLAFRADFDALPIQEENTIEYKSKINGVMHACGHDAHTSSLLGTIRILNHLRDDWEGTLKFVFQPAEEMLPGGAKQMIKEGVLEDPRVKIMIGQHVFPDLEKGKIGFCSGKYMASTDELHVTIKGVGGHAALPEEYNNPILASSKLIVKLYEYFKRYRDLPSVLAIGYIKGLGSTNVIPNSVKLKGTFRAIDEGFREKAHNKMLEISKTIEKTYKIDIDFNIHKGYPCLINDKQVTDQCSRLAKEYLGADNVVELPVRMTAEDFAYYTQVVPSCFYRLGTANSEKGLINGLHTSKFNIDENALKIGMGFMAYLAVKIM